MSKALVICEGTRNQPRFGVAPLPTPKNAFFHPETRQETDVDGAAEQGAPLQRLEDDLVEVSGRLAQVVPLGHAAGEVLEALRGAAARQRLVAAVHPTKWVGAEPFRGVFAPKMRWRGEGEAYLA